jgi:hypothetical protein
MTICFRFQASANQSKNSPSRTRSVVLQTEPSSLLSLAGDVTDPGKPA